MRDGREMRRLVLCADDYGMNAGVSRAIRDLAGRGRISATSCMTNAPGWTEAARALAAEGPAIGIGLHLTLTWGCPLGPMPRLAPGGAFPGLARLMVAALSGRLARPEVEGEIERQLDAFQAGFGQGPDFVDGHQHVHVLPGVRGALLAVLARRGFAGRVWLRDPADRPGAAARRRVGAGKALTVSALAAGFAGDARRHGFATNAGFSGFSAFDPRRATTSREMERHLVALGPRPLLMCHPGLPDPQPDGIAAARLAEHAFLVSSAFGELLGDAQIRLVPAPA